MTERPDPGTEERALWHAELEDRARWMAGADLDDEPADDWDEDDDWCDRDDLGCTRCGGEGYADDAPIRGCSDADPHARRA